MARRVAGSRRERGPAPLQGEPDLVVVGRIGRPQGIKGEVTVEVRTDAPDERFAPDAELLTPTGTLTVERARDHSGRLVVLFAGVEDRSAAEALRGTVLSVDVRTLPPIDDEDEYYDSQLVGLRVEQRDGTVLGQVVEVLHLPHGDVLAVRRHGPGEQELLVPFLRAMVPVVDLAGGRAVVELPEGLLELTDAPADQRPEA
ncbi:MAG TPA: ribosome maturation factor RimM [Mycobacteriales bacterium]|nr:ribosome maturation factor RimM [Mycobacteriales bacterium]